jgi:membrane protein
MRLNKRTNQSALDSWNARIDRWLFEPPDSIIGKPLWLLLRILRFPYALARDVMRGQLTLRAMSLVYTTLLSIVPLIAFSFSILKGLGYHHALEPVLYSFLQPLGDKASELTARIMGFVDNVQSSVLGSIGLAFLLYTVISTIQKVEESFNFIWRVEQPRSFGRRFSEYLSVMVVGPILIVSSFGLLASLSSQSIVAAIRGIEPFGTMLLWLGNLTPYLVVVGVFTFMYAFVPNTRVEKRAAFVGGLAAGVMWAASGAIFASFVAHSTQTIAIYAGFAIVIVALMWLYLSWLILLVGAQLSFYVQNQQYLRPGHREVRLTSSLRERLALAALYTLAHSFRNSTPRWTLSDLAEHLEVPGTALSPVLNALEARDLIVATENEEFIPGRDPQAIALSEILDAVRNDLTGEKMPRLRSVAPAEEAAKMADAAMRESLRGKTVDDLLGDR